MPDAGPDGPSRADARVSFGAAVRVSDGPANSSQGEAEIGVSSNGTTIVGWTDRRLDSSGQPRASVWLRRGASPTGAFEAAMKTGGTADVVIRVDAVDQFYLMSLAPDGLPYARLSPTGDPLASGHIAQTTGVDRPWISFAGSNVAVSWNHQTPNGTGSVVNVSGRVAVSTDNGTSFGPRTVIGSSAQGKALVPTGIAWSPDGALYVGALVIDFAGTYAPGNAVAWDARIYRSDDGGVSFDAEMPLPVDRDVKGHSGIDLSTVAQKSYVQILAPIIHTLPTGRVIAIWVQPTGESLDVVCAASDTKGQSFGEPVKINDDVAPAFHILPGATVDEAGRVHVVWLDGRNTPNAERPPGSGITDGLYVPAYAISRDGCDTFSKNVVLKQQPFRIRTATPSDPTWTTGWVGDMFAIQARGNYVYPIWSDTTTGHAEAYVAVGSVEM